MTKKPFRSIERTSNLIDIVHFDICELNGMLTKGGSKYFITFIDDFSRYTYVCLLKHKNEAFNAFKNYKVQNRKSIRKENQNS